MDADSILTDELKKRIVTSVQDILNQEFNTGPKTRIRDMHNRLNFACPYCGDSTKDNKKKRGNLFWDTLQYHCFNYGCAKHIPIYKFLKDFNISDSISSAERIEIIDFVKANKYNNNNTNSRVEFELFSKLVKLGVDKSQFCKTFNCQSINVNQPGWNFLQDRLLTKFSNNFLYDKKTKKIYILNLDLTGNKIIGFQIRNPWDGANKYLSFNLEKMRQYFGLDTLTHCKDKNELIKLNKISTIFGILNVDFTRTVTAFEGPIDSKFIRNSIGLSTVERNIDQFNDLPNIRYFFDNDSSGRDAMINLIKNGKTVFLWRKFIRDFNLKKYEDDKNPIKDLNDIIKICYKFKLNAYKHINDYFSNKSFDIIYI